MATAEQYGAWIVANKDKRGTPEFEKVAAAYKLARTTPQPKAPEQSTKQNDGVIANTAKGFASGFADVGNTILNAVEGLANRAFPRESLGELEKYALPKSNYNAERAASLQEFNDANKGSTAFNVGRVGGNVAATLPVGGVLGAGAKAVGAAPSIVNALTTSGMRAGTTPGAVNMLTRAGGGAAAGATAAGVIDPEYAGTGAIVGGVLPPALAGAGKVANVVGRTISGPAVQPGVQQAVTAARNAGYVIPPTQAKPTLTNRLLEGFSGKITTAQNASARNQPITNELAKKSIGASELSEAGLAEVRKNANAVYSKLGSAGELATDDVFRKAISDAGVRSEKFAADFPELISKDVDTLLEKFSSKKSFDAQSAIEAIKRLREGQRAGLKAFDDAEKKAYARVQGKIADALEGVVERNLAKNGSADLLASFKEARKTLAKVYDVEKALNTTTGNVDAAKLAAALKKGRPLTGELRQIAEFSGQFPKAAQMTEKMGSLPQTSPLDWGAMGVTSAMTGNPLMMAGVLARPAARSLVLSNAVQNRLATPAGNRLMQLTTNPGAEQLLYRSAPALAASR
jgi:hypothetical protein